MNDAMLKLLGEPFPKAAVKSREGGRGKMLDYVETHTVIHRLNDACPEWSFEIKSMTPHAAPDTRNGESQIMWIAVGSLTIPGLGTREGIGVQTAGEKSEDLVKGAASDALKKAATLFGVALELYGPDYGKVQPIHTQPPSDTNYGPMAVPVGQPTLAQQVRRESPVQHDKGEPQDQPCDVPGCELTCAGKFVSYSQRTYGLNLCGKHSKRAKEGQMDLDQVRMDIANNPHERQEPRRASNGLDPLSLDHNAVIADLGGWKSSLNSTDRVEAWNAFWRLVRPMGYANLQDVARLVKTPLDGLADYPPQTLYDMILEAKA